MSERVCAVLVTYNRLPLLRESLNALARSTRKVDQIVVVDNQSNDGTTAALTGDYPHVYVITPTSNVGCAGGNWLGIGWAKQNGFEWIWTLDDDSIVSSDALEQLFAARDRFADSKPNLLASKVIWTDGSLHPMNIQKPKLYNAVQQFAAAERGTMSIRFTSFVSMLIHRSLVERYGLPVAGYFLWNDDVEYSARMLRKELGVLVPASVVCHKTAIKHVPSTSSPEKYYFEVRNKLWIIRLSPAFSGSEKWWMFKSLCRRTWQHLCDNHFKMSVLTAVINGLWEAMTTSPRHSV